MRYLFTCVILFFIWACQPNSQESPAIITPGYIKDGVYASSKYFPEGLAILNQKGQKVFLDSEGQPAQGWDYAKIQQETGQEHPSFSAFHEGLAIVTYPAKNGGLRWGYVNTQGENPFDTTFDYASEFIDGQAIIKQGKHWGLLGKDGQFIISPQYQAISRISDGKIWIKDNGVWTYHHYPSMEKALADAYQIHGKEKEGMFWVEALPTKTLPTVTQRAFVRKGEGLVTPWLEGATDFSEGLAAVKKEGKWGYIDTTGQWVIPPTFDYANPFSEGLASAILTDNTPQHHWGYINRKGEWVIPQQFSIANAFQEGMAEVQNLAGQKGFINTQGKLVLDYEFDTAFPYNEGLAAVQQEGRWGFVDTAGIVVIPFQYDKVGAFPDEPYDGGFSAGLAKVAVDGYEFFINKKGKCVLGCLE